jgi:hypothetical protein
MDERIARLRGHQQNISRYQNMLKTRLSEVELHFLEKRLSEERFKIAMLEFMSPPSVQRTIDLDGARE